MPFKRKRRDGSVVFYASYQGPDGSWVQERCPIADKRAALDLERRRRREVQAGVWVDPRGASRSSAARAVTVMEYFREDLEGYRLRNRPGTVTGHVEMFERHVAPVLGSKRLDAVRYGDIETLVANARGKGLAPKTIANVYGCARGLFRRAHRRGHLLEDPFDAVDRRDLLPSLEEPKQNPRSKNPGPWTRAESEALISAPAIPERWRVVWAVLLFTGMRIGEATGLRWADLDTTAKPLGRITLTKQRGGRPLKNNKRRELPVHPELARVLASWKLRGWVEHVGRHPEPHDPVLPNDRAGELTQSACYTRLQADCLRVGITQRRLHDTRHTFASLLVEAGSTIEVVNRVLEGVPSKRAPVVKRYVSTSWEASCAAVQALPLRVGTWGEVVTLPVAVGDARTSGRHDASHDAGRFVAFSPAKGARRSVASTST